MSAIGNLFRSLFAKESTIERYQWKANSEGLTFFVSASSADEIKNGQASLWLSHQHLILNMLAEQDQAEPIPNGFIVPTEVVVSLDDASRESLELPEIWNGHIRGSFKGQTSRSNFSMMLEFATEPTRYTGRYQTEGPMLELDNQFYLQAQGQALIFSALTKHSSSKRTESDNLRLVMALEEAQRAGVNLTLSVFDKMEIKSPNQVTVAAELDPEGNLILTPNFGQNATHEQMQKVLGQLRSETDSVIRVGEEIILLDEIRLKAAHEILKNRVVPKDKIAEFYKTPSAFIDASLIELDVGFSARVKGAAYFKHAYFGETDESGIGWFGDGKAKSESVLPIGQLINHIRDYEDLREFEQKWVDAKKTKSQSLEFRELLFDVSDAETVEQAIATIKVALDSGEMPESPDDPPDDTPTSEDGGDGPDQPEETDPPVGGEVGRETGARGETSVVVNPELNDEELRHNLAKQTTEVSHPKNELDWSGYSRKPYSHQEEGTSWIVGLALSGESGGLLADDMGLGKTFMALSAIEQLHKLRNEEKPCLIVAPLSVLENWKDEVELTFSESPFSDIVILQSDSDMKQYRIGGKETKQDFSGIEIGQELPEGGELAKIRYSLKVGDEYTFDSRLDIPKRLVITTYQTLRDYQFSLCKVHWSMVVFDEAQNTKNPNAMQTRAAKGLNSDFNLLVTGTPVENSLADFWCLMDTAVPGRLGSYQDFREKYITPILQAASDEVYDERIRVGKQLRLDTGALMLRRIKEDNLDGLPSKCIHVGLDTEVNGWSYDERLSSVMQGFQKDNYDAIISANNESDSNQALANLHRLRDVSLHPYLIDKGKLILNQKADIGEITKVLDESGKLGSLLKVLDSIRDKQEKCIIFCINKQLQQFLCLALGKFYSLGVLPVINGDTKTVNKRDAENTRKGMIANFEAKQGFNIIVMSPIAAGVGLTVVGANHAVHLERHWNPAKEAQASDRIYRIGQKKDAHIYIPILHHPRGDSFDVNLHKLLSKKTLLKDAVVTVEQVLPEMPESGSQINRRLEASDLSKLSWQQFEAVCAELFMKDLSASNCWLTPTNDKGADVALFHANEATLLQCKHTKNSNYRGYKAVQEVKSAEPIYSKHLDCDVKNLFFVTNAKRVSAEARSVAEISGVQIFAYAELSELLEIHAIKFGDLFSRLEKARLQM